MFVGLLIHFAGFCHIGFAAAPPEQQIAQHKHTLVKPVVCRHFGTFVGAVIVEAFRLLIEVCKFDGREGMSLCPCLFKILDRLFVVLRYMTALVHKAKYVLCICVAAVCRHFEIFFGIAEVFAESASWSEAQQAVFVGGINMAVVCRIAEVVCRLHKVRLRRVAHTAVAVDTADIVLYLRRLGFHSVVNLQRFLVFAAAYQKFGILAHHKVVVFVHIVFIELHNVLKIVVTADAAFHHCTLV